MNDDVGDGAIPKEDGLDHSITIAVNFFVRIRKLDQQFLENRDNDLEEEPTPGERNHLPKSTRSKSTVSCERAAVRRGAKAESRAKDNRNTRSTQEVEGKTIR